MTAGKPRGRRAIGVPYPSGTRRMVRYGTGTEVPAPQHERGVRVVRAGAALVRSVTR